MDEKAPPKKLNLGCGQCKLEGFLNVDCDEALEPDLVVDLKKPLPFEEGVFEEVLFMHTIEHIEKKWHPTILTEIHRALAENGRLILGYPEFSTCIKYWLENHRGKRDFWEACIYGRQLSPSDFHVSAMDSAELKDLLLSVGFDDIHIKSEDANPQYTILTARKARPRITYAEHLREVIFGDKYGQAEKRSNETSEKP